MDLDTAVLLGVVGVLALNQLVMRVGTLYRVDAVFYGLIVLDWLVGGSILWFGLPGFDAFPAVPVVLGLLFFLHSAQNLNLRRRRWDAARSRHEHAQSDRLAEAAARLDAQERAEREP